MKKPTLENIHVFNGQGSIFVLSQDIRGLSIYEQARLTNRFISRETKILTTAVENDLRRILAKHDILLKDYTNEALEVAFAQLKDKGIELEIVDRYANTQEQVIYRKGSDPIVINEDGILSCSIEIVEKIHGSN